MGERTGAYLVLLDVACRQAACLAASADQTFSSHPHYQIYRSFPAAGPILAARLFAEIGDDVKKGQTLFTIDSADLLQAESTLIAAAGVLDADEPVRLDVETQE